MTTTIIIICVLLLFAYVFDISASKTKIPSVILLLTLGYVAKLFANFFDVDIPNLDNTLPILGIWHSDPHHASSYFYNYFGLSIFAQ